MITEIGLDVKSGIDLPISEQNLMTSHSTKLTNAQVTVIAKRCGGKFIHNGWHFPTPIQRARFNHLVVTQTHTSLLSSLIHFFDDLLGLGSIFFVAAIAVAGVAVWFWGAYQALLWGRLIPVMGTSALAALHTTAASSWYIFNIFAFIHKIGNRTIVIIALVISATLFFGYYYVHYDARPMHHSMQVAS
jgi:hypothetical protein